MPKPENVLRGAQGAPSASVLPTTQASVIPTKWKRVSLFNSSKSVSATPAYYSIKIFGEAIIYTTSQPSAVEVQRLYRAIHPTAAIGQAVIDFLKDNYRATITHIEILKAENK